MTPLPPIDWQRLAEDLGTIHEPPGGRMESGGRDLAMAALEQLVSPSRLCEAVDDYVSGKPGAELARSVLWLLRPWSAMTRCHDVYQSSTDPAKRRSAVELLRVVADARVLPWVSEFLDDPDDDIRVWGTLILDQLLLSNLATVDDCAPLLEKARTHESEQVRAIAADILERPASGTRSGKPVVELWDGVGLGLIVAFPSGVIYSNQTGGTSCLHPELEGVFVPLRSTVLPNTWELQSPERALLACFEDPKHREAGATKGLDEQDADVIDAVLQKARLGSVVRVARDHLHESQEAWVHVTVLSDDTNIPVFHGFGSYPRSGILTWGNSD
jgi:hypothetical protein